MARLPRIYVEGALYYITCRGAHNEKLFKETKDYRMYIRLLEKYKKEYGFKLFAYVLVPRHLHLLIEPDREMGVSEIMRSLNTAYSKYINSTYNRRGHLFRERFRTCMVEKEPYLLKLICYVHFNPVRIGISLSPEEYPYSGVSLYRDRTKSTQEVKEVLGYLGDVSFSEYFEKVKDELPDLHKHLQRGGLLGSKEFIGKVREEIKKSKDASQGQENKQRGRDKKYLVIGTGVVLSLVGLVALMHFLQSQERMVTAEREVRALEEASLSIHIAEDLENTEWEVTFIPLGGGEDGFSDRLRFINSKFISEKLALDGFDPTNYSVMQEGNKIIWETIQTSGDSTVSWRGEIEGSTMQGIVSLRSLKGTQDFSFISRHGRRK